MFDLNFVCRCGEKPRAAEVTLNLHGAEWVCRCGDVHAVRMADGRAVPNEQERVSVMSANYLRRIESEEVNAGA